ncbi:MAG: sulfatase-like hydrolase/transferase [Spirochaetales bacterium]
MKTKKEREPKSITKQLISAGIYFVAALLVETLSFLLMGFNGLPQYLLLDVAVLVMIIGLIFLVPSNKWQIGIYSALIIVQATFAYINIKLYTLFGTVLSINFFNNYKEALSGIGFRLLDGGLIFLFFLLIFGFIFASLLLDKKYFPFKDKKPLGKTKLILLTLMVFSIFQIEGYGAYYSQINSLDIDSVNETAFVNNDPLLYNTLLLKEESFKKFGSFGFYLRDITSTFMVSTDGAYDNALAAVDYMEEGLTSTTGTYTGVSADNNVIVIMADGLEWYAIDQNLTPTLYALMNGGVTATNYYSKEELSTNENLSLLGSMGEDDLTTILPTVIDDVDNNFSYALPNLLKDWGFDYANYFINYQKDFYNQTKTYYNFGFDELYDTLDFALEDFDGTSLNNWQLDSDFIASAIDEIVPSSTEQFFSYITTTNLIGNYSTNDSLQSYLDTLSVSGWVNVLWNTPYASKLTNYMALAMDLDAGVEYLLDKLDSEGILDTTTIILCGNDDVYYNELALKVKGIDEMEPYNTEAYNVPFIISDANLPATEIDTFACTYDIMPTIMDLIGISYNRNMYLGNSLLISNEVTDVMFSFTGGIFNDKLFTENGVDIYDFGVGTTVVEIAEFKTSVENALQKMLLFSYMYKYDLFNA